MLMADKEGFEPSVQNYPYGGLAIHWFKPLTHLSYTTSIQDEAN